jgi:hypothetical protein
LTSLDKRAVATALFIFHTTSQNVGVIYLREHEHTALNTLAQQEYRTSKAQAALIIRNELARLGMVEPEEKSPSIKQSSPLSEAERIGG